jgi:hypothetical protein
MNDIRTKKAGRPSVVNEEALRKLEVFIASGMGISASCHFAGISTSTFYEHKSLDKEFAYRINMAEEWAVFRARQVVLKAIDDGNVDVAKWYLSKKARFEFGTQ